MYQVNYTHSFRSLYLHSQNYNKRNYEKLFVDLPLP